jgi:lipoyl(octanoyl) transferase
VADRSVAQTRDGPAPGRAPEPRERVLTAAWFGRVDYAAAWAWQREVFLDRLEDETGDALLLLEHPPTYTLGRRSLEQDLLLGEAQRRARGIATYRVDRGGRATYHGPGQLVAYPIVRLGERYDVIAYLRKLEEAVIRTVADLGVEAGRDAGHTGVWVGRNKLAAVGVKITRGITMHGFALNVTTDLSMFSGIVPCGIAEDGRWVTSVAAETGVAHSVKEVATTAARRVAEVFDAGLVWAHPRTLVGSGAAEGVSAPAGRARRE